MFYFWELLISLIVIAEPVVQCLSKSTKASVSAVSFSLSFSFFLLLFLLLLLLLVYSSSFPSTVSLKVLILWQFFCDFLTYMYFISMICVFISTAERCSQNRCLQRFPSYLPLIAFEDLSLYIQKHLGQSVAVCGSLWKGRSWQTKAEPGTARYSAEKTHHVLYF